MEKIVEAAIRYEIREEPGDKHIESAPYHHTCMDNINFKGVKHPLNVEYGFMTSSGRFVDKEEAYTVAEEAKQIVREHSKRILDSLNLKSCSTCLYKGLIKSEEAQMKCDNCDNFSCYE